jgi:hypothetical protein
MGIFGALSIVVFVLGLAIYLFCSGGITKATMAQVGRTMFFCGLLSWLMSAGAQSCTMGVANGGGGSAQHH